MKKAEGKIIFFLSLILALLVIITSGISLLSTNFYGKETFNWATQSTGQDGIDFFLIAPLLIIISLFAYRKRAALLLWGGVIFYLVYTYVIYCFTLHFNRFFIVYCIILGLSFYLFQYFLISQVQKRMVKSITNKIVRKVIGIYLITIACLFYLLWLAEIIPAIINNVTPSSLIETGLFTNPVHVIDLSICLPALFITGFLLLKQNALGSVLAPAMLVFCILMDITIGVLVILMNARGLGSDYSVAVVMFILALLSMMLLIWFIKQVDIVE